jgi:hypothetical protein
MLPGNTPPPPPPPAACTWCTRARESDGSASDTAPWLLFLFQKVDHKHAQWQSSMPQDSYIIIVESNASVDRIENSSGSPRRRSRSALSFAFVRRWPAHSFPALNVPNPESEGWCHGGRNEAIGILSPNRRLRSVCASAAHRAESSSRHSCVSVVVSRGLQLMFGTRRLGALPTRPTRSD